MTPPDSAHQKAAADQVRRHLGDRPREEVRVERPPPGRALRPARRPRCSPRGDQGLGRVELVEHRARAPCRPAAALASTDASADRSGGAMSAEPGGGELVGPGLLQADPALEAGAHEAPDGLVGAAERPPQRDQVVGEVGRGEGAARPARRPCGRGGSRPSRSSRSSPAAAGRPCPWRRRGRPCPPGGPCCRPAAGRGGPRAARRGPPPGAAPSRGPARRRPGSSSGAASRSPTRRRRRARRTRAPRRPRGRSRRPGARGARRAGRRSAGSPPGASRLPTASRLFGLGRVEPEVLGHRGPVHGEAHPGQRPRAQRALGRGVDDVPQAGAVAAEHPDVCQQVVGQAHRLGALPVRVAGQERVDVGLGLAQQRLGQAAQQPAPGSLRAHANRGGRR